MLATINTPKIRKILFLSMTKILHILLLQECFNLDIEL
jgi:hypothetical protein